MQPDEHRLPLSPIVPPPYVHLTPPLTGARALECYESEFLLVTSNSSGPSMLLTWCCCLLSCRLDRANVTYLNEYYRNRLRALKAVDELVETVGKTGDTHHSCDSCAFG
jgi:hypothetical protein